MKKKDKYDEAVEFLTENPLQIHDAWMAGFRVINESESQTIRSGVLFKAVSDNSIECLTTIRNSSKGFCEDGVEGKIKKDKRIPRSVHDIRIKHLPIFAEWQRKLDKINKRKRAKK